MYMQICDFLSPQFRSSLVLQLNMIESKSIGEMLHPLIMYQCHNIK